MRIASTGDITSTNATGSKPILTLENTTNDANSSQLLFLKNRTATNNDNLGTVRFRGNNNAGTPEVVEYATIYAQSTNVADSAEDGQMIFRTMKDGTLGARLTIDGTGLATFSDGITVSGGFTTVGNYSTLTVSGGAITATRSTHYIRTESSAATDNLDTINGGSNGTILVLSSYADAEDVTVRSGYGNIYLAGSNFAMNSARDTITLIKNGSNWVELSRADND